MVHKFLIFFNPPYNLKIPQFGVRIGRQFPLTLMGMQVKKFAFFLKQQIVRSGDILVMPILISIPNAAVK